MTHASLFSGIGGFDLAAEWMGWENIFQVEIDKFCTKVLEKNFPNVTRYGDIKEFNGSRYTGNIDILTGGFPCQPFSKAGLRKGEGDNRYLWPENIRVIREIKPEWVVGENVTGIETMGLDLVHASLEDEGYEVEIFSIPASAVGAWHRRERIWIVAHNSSNRSHKHEPKKGCNINPLRSAISEACQSTDTYSKSMEGHSRYEYTRERWTNEVGRNGQSYWAFPWNEVAPAFCRDNDGVSNRVDRIKSLGNAIVPQVAFEIFKAIELTWQEMPSSHRPPNSHSKH